MTENELREMARGLLADATWGDEFGSYAIDPAQAETIILAALLKAKEAGERQERARWQPAATYFERYALDEAEATAYCVSEQHHEDAKAFASVVAFAIRQDTGRG
jgi:hypothetical protein